MLIFTSLWLETLILCVKFVNHKSVLHWFIFGSHLQLSYVGRIGNIDWSLYFQPDHLACPSYWLFSHTHSQNYSLWMASTLGINVTRLPASFCITWKNIGQITCIIYDFIMNTKASGKSVSRLDWTMFHDWTFLDFSYTTKLLGDNHVYTGH